MQRTSQQPQRSSAVPQRGSNMGIGGDYTASFTGASQAGEEKEVEFRSQRWDEDGDDDRCLLLY